MEGHHVAVYNYTDFGDSLFGSGPSDPATVSFRVRWDVPGPLATVNVNDPINKGVYAGEIVHSTEGSAAQMEWTASVGNYRFASDRIGTSGSSFAEIGKLRDGIFLAP
jgi:hypothetical protein